MVDESHESKAASEDATLMLSMPWVIAFVPILVIIIGIPYFFSSYVLITPNPVDVAIVDFFGAEWVKPSLLALLLLGSGIGLVASRFNRTLFQNVETSGCVTMKGPRMWSRIFLPWFGLLLYPIYQIITYLLLGPSWNWGALSLFFFIFPGFGFILSTSVMYLMTYNRVKRNARERGLILKMIHTFRTPIKKGFWQIRLIKEEVLYC
ncbi:MAG: hypothetical protein E4H14_13780 [Candidatus Thorarchaeota archaeon]|nr:MAG: hypothetical protein E4H14_13780 [Candidatus Thorarchaeota archaeon]